MAPGAYRKVQAFSRFHVIGSRTRAARARKLLVSALLATSWICFSWTRARVQRSAQHPSHAHRPTTQLVDAYRPLL